MYISKGHEETWQHLILTFESFQAQAVIDMEPCMQSAKKHCIL